MMLNFDRFVNLVFRSQWGMISRIGCERRARKYPIVRLGESLTIATPVKAWVAASIRGVYGTRASNVKCLFV